MPLLPGGQRGSSSSSSSAAHVKEARASGVAKARGTTWKETTTSARRARFPTAASRTGRGASGVRLRSWTAAGFAMYVCNTRKASSERGEERKGEREKTHLCAGPLLRMQMRGCTAAAARFGVGRGAGAGAGAGREHARALLRCHRRHGLPLASSSTGGLPARAHAHARLGAGNVRPPTRQQLLLALPRTAPRPPRALRLRVCAHVRALSAPLDDLLFVLGAPRFLFRGGGDGRGGRGGRPGGRGRLGRGG